MLAMKFHLMILAILITLPGLAQQKITGKVTSTTNEPLADVSVKVKGSSVGATTDNAGNFSLTLPRDRETLVFSIVGYQSKEVVIGAQTTINVQLESTTKAMEDIVVVGYGRQRKSDVTGAVASIPKDRIDNMVRTDVLQLLQGATAGLNVTTTA